MIDRIVEIANPARLSVRDAQLVIESGKDDQLSLPFTTPISEIAVLLLAHPQINLSQAVLSRIAEAGGSVVTINGNFLPSSMLLPVDSHFIQTERFAKQMQLWSLQVSDFGNTSSEQRLRLKVKCSASCTETTTA